MRETILKQLEELEGVRLRVDHTIPVLVERTPYYPLDNVIRDKMARAMMHKIIEKHFEKETHDYMVRFSLDLYVFTPEQFFKIIHDMAMELKDLEPRMRVMP